MSVDDRSRVRSRRGRRRARAAPLPAIFWVLWTSHLLYWTVRFTMIFLSLFLTVEMGLSASATGMHLAAFGLGGIVSVLVGGAVSDAIGRRPALLGSLVASALLTTLLALMGPGVLLVLVLFGLGAASFMTKPVFETLIADVVDPDHRHRAYSLDFVAINTGFLVSPQIAAWLVERSYTAMLLAEAGAMVLVTAVVAISVPSDRRRRAPSPGVQPTGVLGGIGSVFRDRAFVAFVVLNLVFMLVLIQNTLSLPIYMADQGYSTRQFAWLLTLNGAILIVFQMPVSAWVQRRRSSTMLALASALMALGYAVYPFADAWWILAGGVVVWTSGELINMPTAAWVASRFGPVEFRGRYLGVFALTSSVAFLVGPLLSGFLLELAGPRALWWTCAVLMLLSACGRWLIGGHQEARVGHQA